MNNHISFENLKEENIKTQNNIITNLEQNAKKTITANKKIIPSIDKTFETELKAEPRISKNNYKNNSESEISDPFLLIPPKVRHNKI